MKRILLSTMLIVIGLSAFSQSPSRSICLRPAYPLVIGETAVEGISYNNNGLYMYDILQDSLPQYEIGHIFAQTVRYTEAGHGFYVKADSLNSLNIKYSYEVDEAPQGIIEFNNATCRFKYYPAAEDYKSFTITFTATNDTESVSENVEFNLMPQTAPEKFAFQTQGTMPAASDYILVAETSKAMLLNNEERTAYSVSISGKDVVFDDGVKNKVYGLNGREDIYELNIYAERLIVRSALSFPQTNITVYAKELVFEDHDTVFASINTTPTTINTLSIGESTQHGASAGDIALYIRDFKGNMAKRLILNGAQGQNSTRDGTPGNGGSGGMVVSTIAIDGYCDFTRGSCGVRYNVADDGSATKGTIIGSGNMGSDGHFELINTPHAYLHPYFISAVVRYANDAFINNYTDEALRVCNEYRMLIDEYMNTPEWDACGDEESTKLRNDLREIDDMLLRLNQGLDYFGNPAGWVPLLSFEVMLANYDAEIDRAIPTLYMYYWLNRIDQTLQHKVEASEFAASSTAQEIQNCQAQLNTLALELPVLKDQAEEVAAMINDLTAQMNALKERLLAKAKKNIKKKNRINKAVGICQSVISCIPVYGTTINTAVNVAKNIAYATGAFSNITGVDNYGFTNVFDNVGSADYGKMIEQIKNAYSSFSLDTLGKNASYLKDTYKSVSDAMAPLTNSFNNINKLLSQSSTPSDQVETELERLKAESIEWQSMLAEMEKLNQKKTEIDDKLVKNQYNISSTLVTMSGKIIALDDLRRDVFTDNSKRDLNAMQYLEKMNQEAKARLLKYYYYLRKAYEYRLLRPYTGEFNLVGMYDRFADFVKKGSEVALSNDDYSSLAGTYKSEISKMAEEIIDEYSVNYPEQSAPITIVIPKEQLDIINTDENYSLNFYDMGIFAPDEENVRIVDLGIQHIETHVDGNVGYSGYMDLNMTHSGISRFRKDGQIYWFDHRSKSTTSPHTWGLRYDAVSKESTNIQPSAASSSLLASILKNSGNIMLFSRPAAWGDVTLSKKVHTSGGADVVIDSLVLRLQYDFTRRPNKLRNIDITTNEGLPYIACSVEDINGRSNGNGVLNRSYTISSQPVTFTAIKQYGQYHFVNWTDRGGKVVSDKMDLTVNRATDQFYRANYERRVPILNVPDTIKVGYSGGVYTVNVENIGSGNIEMDWYVSDSLSSWVHLNGESEGIDDGAFSFEYDTNESGIYRLDSLEIFAPETDVMSKMIYIAQVDDFNSGIKQVETPNEKIRLFPNPAREYVTIEGEGILSVRLFSLAGREIYHKVGGDNHITIDISNLPNGMYICAVKTKKGLICEKVLKIK